MLLLLLLLFSIAGVAGRRIFFFLGNGGNLYYGLQGQTRKKKSTTYNIRTVDANEKSGARLLEVLGLLVRMPGVKVIVSPGSRDSSLFSF